MSKVIETILSAKNVQASQEEIQALAHQWEAIQQLKQSFQQAELDDRDIAMTHDLRGVYHD